LEDEADLAGSDPCERVVAAAGHIDTVDFDNALSGPVEGSHHVEQRGLTAAGGTDDPEELAVVDAQ